MYRRRVVHRARFCEADVVPELPPVPESLTLDEAYRAAFHLVSQYIDLEHEPDTGLVLLQQYLKSDPARWDDWKTAVRHAMDADTETPLAENLLRDE